MHSILKLTLVTYQGTDFVPELYYDLALLLVIKYCANRSE